MRRKLLLSAVAFFSLALQAANAQTVRKIHGIVRDNKNELLQGISVSLLRAGDSSLQKAAVTDVNGSFEIETLLADSCILGYAGAGFQYRYVLVSLSGDREDYAVADVSLENATENLKDVVITGRKPTIEIRADKVVFNVEGSINAVGNNALELLQKSPGVMVSNEESISLKGRSDVKIYIDGKMSQLDSKSLADYLKSLNSSDIQAIEIIANPGARYDASGSAGVINIRLKKSRKLGTNGSIEAGGGKGREVRGNSGLSLNYRDKKVNVFGSVNGNAGKNENDLLIYRLQQDTAYDQHTIMRNEWKNVDLKAGADYFLNAENTIGVVVTSNFSDKTFSTGGKTDIFPQGSNQLAKTLQASNRAPSDRTNAGFNMNYRYADTNGTTIGFDADYGLYRSQTHSYQPNNYYDAENIWMYRIVNGNSTPTDIDIYTAKLDMEHKLGKGTISYGAKYAYVKTDNAVDFYNYKDGDPEPVTDLSKSNRFVYTENVNAAYASYNRTMGDWSLQAGLRAEQTNSEGKLTRMDGQAAPDDDVKRHYLNFFPSAVLSYMIDKKNAVGLNYSRHIDRPNYQDLNPFELKLDQLTYEKGNAFLKPQYTNNIELNYTFMSMVTASVGYAHTRDYAVRITDTINGNASYLQSRNLASRNVYTFNVSTPLPIRKWWNGYFNFWCNYQSIDGLFNGGNISINAASFGVYMQHSFSLGKGYTAEWSGWFSGNGIEAAWKRKPIGSVDIGVQKRFWNDRANLKLSLSDVFKTIQFNALTDYGGIYMRINQSNDTRILRINFAYRFGNSQVKAARQHKTALDNEGSRIK